MSKSKKNKNENDIMNETVAAEVETNDAINSADEINTENIADTTEKADNTDTIDTTNAADVRIGVVNVEKLNVRKEDSIESDVVKVISKGDKVNIIEEKGEFYKVDIGFVMKKFIDER